MATKFDFKKSPDVNGTADKTTLYPKIVVAGTKNLENIADDIAKRSGFKAGTVIGLFSDLENLLTDYLADGYNVKLGEIGTFSATLTSRKVTDKKEIRSGSVHFDSQVQAGTPLCQRGMQKGRNGTGTRRPRIRLQDIFSQAHSGRAIRHADGIPEGIPLHHPTGILQSDGSAENQSCP